MQENLENRPFILVVNDDGITAPGIRSLIEFVKPYGEIMVVAPDQSMSGMGHAVTINSTLKLNEYAGNAGVKEFACTGTPVDCVKFASKLIGDRKFDLLVSGINHGPNSSINVIYSGTMSAAMEGTIEGIPSIGFSLDDHALDANFAHCKWVVQKLVEQVLESKDPNICLNVNIPNVPEDEMQGIKFCRQAKAMWREDFEERKSPQGQKYYWLTGEFIALEEGEDTDIWALKNNYVSVVPVQSDLTNYTMLDKLKEDAK
jgi:5'-nucleotidase